MKRLLLPLLTALALHASESAFASLPSVFIKDCYDGDTCTTLKGENIRLACIDTPELKGWNADPIPAKEARDFVNKLVANEEVSIKRITRDRYNRTVAELSLQGENIQQMMVKRGYAQIYQKYSFQCPWAR